MADGNTAEKLDTLPAPAPRQVRGVQSERDGALIPDAYGELPWPMVREHGVTGTIDILTRFSMRHRETSCMGECDEFERCERHRHSAHIAEAAMQVRTILDAFEKRCGVPASLAVAETLREDVLALAMGKRRRR